MRIAMKILEGKMEEWLTTLPDIKTAQHQDRNKKQKNDRKESSQIGTHICGSIIYNIDDVSIQWQKNALFLNAFIACKKIM